MITNLFADKPTDMKLERCKNITCSIFGLNIQSILNLSVNKGIHLLIFGICLSFMANAQVSKSVISTAGRLAAVLTTAELQTVTDLAITGTIDARDFKAMRDDMPLLSVLDLSEVTITAYSGANGTFSLGNFDFPADEVPYSAFYDSNSVGKYSLTSVVLPKSINSIGQFAFRDCIGITSFIIPGVIHSIGDYAFGIQIKPVTTNANFGNYSASERMKASFDSFKKKYKGKVFIVLSNKEKITNEKVIAEIEDEVNRLSKLKQQ